MSVVVRGQKRSIGEVLALLKSEFPEISISKIRFLEGQGLLQPERTASGYRKFTDNDVARLRYILRLQREQFLPLKVIKERLEEQESALRKSSDDVVDLTTSGELAGTPFSALIARRDLLSDSGLTDGQLKDLENFGMVQGQSTPQGLYYDADAMVVARLASRFLATGVEVRHLRVFKTTVDREADLYTQMVPPVRSARNPQAAAEAHARLQELTELGQNMRAELLRQRLNS